MNLAHSNLTLLPVFGGDYDQTIYLYIHLITLKRLGCGDKLTNVEYQGLLEDKFYSMYQFPQSVPIATAMEQVVEEIQSALHILNILPSQIPIDGVFNNVTLDAVHVYLHFFLHKTFLNQLFKKKKRNFRFNIIACLIVLVNCLKLALSLKKLIKLLTNMYPLFRKNWKI